MRSPLDGLLSRLHLSFPNTLDLELSLSSGLEGYCDYNHLYRALEDVQRASIMPPKSQVFRLLLMWQAALADFPLSFALSDLFRVVFPQDAALPQQAHRAKPDVEMMYKLARLYFDGTLRPAARQKITSYYLPVATEDIPANTQDLEGKDQDKNRRTRRFGVGRQSHELEASENGLLGVEEVQNVGFEDQERGKGE